MKKAQRNTIIFFHLLMMLIFTACGSVKHTFESTSVTVSNSSNLDRFSETIEIPWKDLGKLKQLDPKEIIVRHKDSGEEIPSQILFNGEKSPQSIIFQTNIPAKTIQAFIFVKGIPKKYITKTYGRQIPERFNDFAWENDKVAFRMYGEALENQKGMAKGIDFWAKRTSNLVINEWYKSGNYHKDNGDGVDAYHVGMTLGAGDAAPIEKDEIIYPINYSEYQILDSGPIRISFKLTYKPFEVKGKAVIQTKTISLDAGSQMNKIVVAYQKMDGLQIAIGVTKHKNDGLAKISKTNNYVAYWDQADGGIGNGFMGVGVVYPFQDAKEVKESKQHVLMIVEPDKNNDVIYYQGGGWSKSGNFAKPEVWFEYLEQFSVKLKNPLTIKHN